MVQKLPFLFTQSSINIYIIIKLTRDPGKGATRQEKGRNKTRQASSGERTPFKLGRLKCM